MKAALAARLSSILSVLFCDRGQLTYPALYPKLSSQGLGCPSSGGSFLYNRAILVTRPIFNFCAPSQLLPLVPLYPLLPLLLLTWLRGTSTLDSPRSPRSWLYSSFSSAALTAYPQA